MLSWIKLNNSPKEPKHKENNLRVKIDITTLCVCAHVCMQTRFGPNLRFGCEKEPDSHAQYVSCRRRECDSSMNTKCSSGQRISCRHSDACQVQVILITAIIYTAETKWRGGTEPGCQAAAQSYWLEEAHFLALLIFLSPHLAIFSCSFSLGPTPIPGERNMQCEH